MAASLLLGWWLVNLQLFRKQNGHLEARRELGAPPNHGKPDQREVGGNKDGSEEQLSRH
jgi:hypothetical protein